MRIAWVGGRGVPALYGGFETAVSEIGARLVERGHEVDVYCRRGYGAEDDDTYRGMRKIFLPRIPVRTIETLSHTLLSMMHAMANPPDVLLVVNPANGPLCILPRLRRIPFAVNVDGLDWERGKWPWIGRRYIYFASWACTRIAPVLIADSHAIQQFYRDRWGADPHYASYGAYEVYSTNQQLLEAYDLTPDDYFVVLARLERENNTDLILKAFERVKTDKELVVVGGSQYEDDYQRELKAFERDPRIRFLGPVYDWAKLSEILCNAYAYVHGHSVGGTNPALLKALGCGAAAVHLDVPFNREVVDGAGLAFPHDATGAAEVLQRVADDPALVEDLRSRARPRIREAYTWERATDDYERLCQALCNGPANTADSRS